MLVTLASDEEAVVLPLSVDVCHIHLTNALGVTTKLNEQN
jgi:hypothetical protein